MDFFNSDTKDEDREYVRGLKDCDSKTKELLLNNHKMCNALVEHSENSIVKKTLLTTAQLPARLMKNGLNCKGPCMLKCDIASALQNQIGSIPESCMVTKIKLLNCNYDSSDPTRKLHVAVAGGAATGMYMECKALGFDDEPHAELGKAHLLTLNSGSVLNDVGTIYDQSEFLENPVYQRYRAALYQDPHKDRSDINAKVSAASSSFYTSPYMRNIGSGAKDVSEDGGVVTMKLMDGDEVSSQGDYWIDLMSKNLQHLPGSLDGAAPVAQWVDAGPGQPEVLQIKTTMADCDKVMETVQSAILAPLRERTINLSEGEGLTLKMQTTEAPSELSNGEVQVTDWAERTSASMTLQIEVAYDKNELDASQASA